jgi:tetratricopeptide (TPR) repeat protein
MNILKQIRQLFTLLLIILSMFQACGQVDKNTEENINKATDYFNNQEYPKTLIYVDKLLKSNPLDYASWTLKGRTLFNLGRKEEAILAINKAIELNPKYYKAYGYRAVICKETEGYTYEQMMADIELAIENDPTNNELISIRANYLIKAGQFDKALVAYEKLLKTEPTNYTFIVSHAGAHRKLGHQELALQGYQKAIEIDSNQSFAYEDRAWLFMEQKQYSQAIKDYNKVIQFISNQSDEIAVSLKAYAFNNRGYAYYKAGNNQQAILDIKYSLELLPLNSYAYKNRALVYFAMAEKNKGCADLKKSLELGYTQQYGDEVEKLIGENCK